MPHLVPIQLEDGTVIYMESTENSDISSMNIGESAQEEGLVSRVRISEQLRKPYDLILSTR